MIKVGMKGDLGSDDIYINPAHVVAVMPVFDNGVQILGACRVYLAYMPAPIFVDESQESLASRIMSGGGLIS